MRRMVNNTLKRDPVAYLQAGVEAGEVAYRGSAGHASAAAESNQAVAALCDSGRLNRKPWHMSQARPARKSRWPGVSTPSATTARPRWCARPMVAYQKYFAGELKEESYDEKELAMALSGLPSVAEPV